MHKFVHMSSKATRSLVFLVESNPRMLDTLLRGPAFLLSKIPIIRRVFGAPRCIHRPRSNPHEVSLVHGCFVVESGVDHGAM